MRTHAEQIARRCKHFNGIMNDKCDAGVLYVTVRDATKSPYTWPCFRDKPCEKTCDKAEFFTPEEVQAQVEDSDRRIKRVITAMNACHEDAKRKGLKKEHGGKDSCACPICKGKLHYSVSGYNGHLWGQCETKDCVSWMQ